MQYIIGDDITTIDLNFLYDIPGSDVEFIQLMIKTFIENISIVIEKMPGYFEKKDWDNLAKTAHFAKSSLSVIQIKQMVELIKSIEVKSKTKNETNSLEEEIIQFKNQFARAKVFLKNHININ